MILLIFLILSFSIYIHAELPNAQEFSITNPLKQFIKTDRLNLVLFTDKKCVHCESCRNAFNVLTEVN